MITEEHLAALIAFVALGANLLGGSLLLLFNPRSRAVRWFAVFTTAQLLWLLLQGIDLLIKLPPEWRQVYAVTVHFLPALFMAAGLAQVRANMIWLPLLPIAAALLLLPLLLPDPLSSPQTIVWQGIGWGIPAVLYFQARQLKREPLPASGRVLNLILTGVVPVGVVGSIMMGGGFVLFFLPVMTIAAQLLIFTGVLHHRYYDIEVRAARTGELAAGAAERDRLALLGELAATIAHEVRNPLTGIRSLTQRIAHEPLDDEKRGRYAEVILGEISRLDRIVGNLTDLARRGTASGGAAGPVELAPLFDDLCLLTDARARKAGARIVAARAHVQVRAPREPLAQALLNLLLNAIEHAPAGSVVELAAERTAGRVAIRVRDHGPGVKADMREHIFEPFHTGRAGGTGLGLTVVRRLAQEHDWQLDLIDAPGGGAEFRVLVPAAQA